MTFAVLPHLQQLFAGLKSSAEQFSLRHVSETSQYYSVRKNVAEPPQLNADQGAMLTVQLGGVQAYAATADLSLAGLQAALEQAENLARQLARHRLIDLSQQPMSSAHGEFISPNLATPLPPASHWLELLMAESRRVPKHDRLVNWQVGLTFKRVEQIYLTSAGGQIFQAQQFINGDMAVTAYDGHDSQTRSLGGSHLAQQGGAEIIARMGLKGAALRLADEALELVAAPNTPVGPRDLVLLPDQMVLQIHESIGHPLEMDRILGDERNYAGTSFVKAEDFGHLQYGSELLNVTFDPSVPEEIASYGHDDDGTVAEKAYLIQNGKLLRPLGGTLSALRSGLPAVANSRACNWNRAPIDRMANINIEPGDKSLAQMISTMERGILMSNNRSWSIDDARNKFQFGCEWAQLIENGELGKVVKNPNYRGISSSFWRSLKAVGNASTRQVMGTPNCGKGEPNQVIRVGHASPTCVFGGVDVFGGAL